MVAVMMIFAIALPVTAARNISVVIDGTPVVFKQGYGEPYINKDSRTMIPLRGALESFGAKVGWNSGTKTASVVYGDTRISVPIGEKYIYVNGVKKDNDTTSIIKDGGRTYLPIRIILESCGAYVQWNGSTSTVIVTKKDQETPPMPTQEMKAMWISYIELNDLPRTENGFKTAINTMFDKCKSYGMNAVIVHVRSHSDAMYPSDYFPWSKYISGTQGKNPGYDPLEYMITAAHDRGLEFHAWINPYRVCSEAEWSKLSSDNPAKKWRSDNDTSNDRWVLKHQSNYYYNPSVPQVRQLIINGVKEIVQKYDVDGIHFDDYFYPTVGDVSATWFDKPEYDASGSSLSLVNWRRANVNTLVKDTYSAVKAIKTQVVFGISPHGNVNNLRSSTQYFVDIDTWMSKSGYIDYIMPQLYWGFEAKSGGKLASWAYNNNLQTWINLKKKGNVDLMIGLAMYKVGTDNKEGNPTSEWLRYNDIIKRQVEAGRASGQVEGYAFYGYKNFLSDVARQEVQNLKKIL